MDIAITESGVGRHPRGWIIKLHRGGQKNEEDYRVPYICRISYYYLLFFCQR